MPRFLHYILWVLCIVSIFLLTWYGVDMSHTRENSTFSHQQVAIVLDVSKSMSVQDMENSDRLTVAKQEIIELLNTYPWVAFSLNIFAGESLRILPFTTDYGLFTTFITGAGSHNVSSQWTRLDTAIEDALKNFSSEQSGYIVVLTDGGEEDITLSDESIAMIQEQGISVLFIAIWSAKWGKIISWYDVFDRPVYSYYQWTPVISQLDVDMLKDVAQQVAGKVYLIDDIDASEYFDFLPVDYTQKQSTILLIWSFISYILMIVILFSPFFIPQKYNAV